MRRINIREFRQTYAEQVSDLPLIVTRKGKDYFVVVTKEMLSKSQCMYVEGCESIVIERYLLQHLKTKVRSIVWLCAFHAGIYAENNEYKIDLSVQKFVYTPPDDKTSEQNKKTDLASINDVYISNHGVYTRCSYPKCSKLDAVPTRKTYTAEGGIETEQVVPLCEVHQDK